jgi:methionyl-tRNA formyltransferase
VTVRVGFITGHQFGCRALAGIFSAEAYLSKQLEVPLVLGLAESHRSHTVGYESPEALAGESGAYFEDVVDGTLVASAALIDGLGLNHLLVVGWSRLVASEVLELPRGDAAGAHRCIGMHPTPLPLGRGQAPIP